MKESRGGLWLAWGSCLALLALAPAISPVIPKRLDPWYRAEASVAGFVLSLLALTAAVGTFALRETLVLRDIRAGSLDPGTPAGFVRMRRALFVLWVLCLAIGLFGGLLAWGAASPALAWPYTIAAAVLLLIHAPRDWLFTRSLS